MNVVCIAFPSDDCFQQIFNFPATSMAVMCKTRRRADYDGRGGVAGQCKGEHQSSIVLQVLAHE
jgi:hypothetical protein